MFKLEFETRNASFRDDYDNIDPSGMEVKQILVKVGRAISNGATEGVAVDSCGNVVGSWSYTDD